MIRRIVRALLGESGFIVFRGLWWRARLRVGNYEPETRALPLLVPWGGVCVDAGGNFGQYAYYLSRIVGASGIVHSFEPLSYNRRVFVRVVRAPNVVLHTFALGAARGKARIEVTANNTGEAHVADTGELVDVVPLDDLGITRLDFIKIDVEGFELEVLRGAEQLIERFHPAILCEIQHHAARYGHTPEETFAFLAAHGYRAYIWRDAKLVDVDGPQEGTINYIFKCGG